MSIATTTVNMWDGTESNNLYYLETKDRKHEIIDKLEDLAPSELINELRP